MKLIRILVAANLLVLHSLALYYFPESHVPLLHPNRLAHKNDGAVRHDSTFQRHCHPLPSIPPTTTILIPL